MAKTRLMPTTKKKEMNMIKTYKYNKVLAPFYKGGREGGFFHVILKREPLRLTDIVTVQNLLFYTTGKTLKQVQSDNSSHYEPNLLYKPRHPPLDKFEKIINMVMS